MPTVLVDAPAEAPLPTPHAAAQPPLTGAALVKADLSWAGLTLLLVVAVFVMLLHARGIGVPLFMAMALAYVLGPMTQALEGRGVGRTGAVGMLFLSGAAASAWAVLLLVPALDEEGRKLPTFLQKALERVLPLLSKYLGIHLSSNTTKLLSELGQKIAEMSDDLVPYALKALGSAGSVLVALFTLAIVPVIAFHFMRESPRWLGWLETLIPPRHRAHVVGRFGQVDAVLSAFVRGQLTVGAVLATIYGIGFSIAGLDLGVGIALVAGFGNMVPYAGTGMGIVLTMLSLLVSQMQSWQLGVVAITWGIAQTLEPLVITPRIVGGRVGLHPAAIILAVLGFGELFGFVGVLLAVPTTATLLVVARVLLDRYRESAFYVGPA